MPNKYLLDYAEKVWKSRWEMSKVYWIAFGPFSKALGKPLINAQIKPISAGQMFSLTLCEEIQEMRPSVNRKKAELTSRY